MTRDTAVAMLDVDSQIQLLSRVQFLTRFSSNLIQITGRDGAGKTWLAQRYLELWAGQSNQSLLLCHPSQSLAQHRSILLKQLIPQPVFNEQDPILQSLEHMLVGGLPVNLLLVIDEAHLLSATLVAELWALVQKAKATPGWQVNVLLFSQPGRLDKYLSQASHGQGSTPLELEITDFSEQEVQTFVEVVFAFDRLEANRRRNLKEQARLVEPLPGALMQLENTEQTTMAGRSSRQLSPLILMLALLVVAVAGIGTWFFSQPPTAGEADLEMAPEIAALSVLESRETQAPQPALSTGRFDDMPSQSPLALPADETKQPALTQQRAGSVPIVEDSGSLPPAVSVEGLTVGRSDTPPRVVVPSDVVDAMLSEQALGGSGELAAAALVPSATETGLTPPTAPASVASAPQDPDSSATSPSAPVTQAAPASAPALEAAPVSAPLPAAAPTPQLGVALKAVDARHYALQLAALRSLTAANQFIAQYDIARIANIYETRRNGEPWFIIVTGDYPSVVSARRAESRLPARLQQVQPWVKSYAQIHREIDRVK
ncbi:AAA family ATPase [Photobacterium sp. TY1-4]|uniref:AAA family ATPase n=1 Tax=Photobacterium sp. TY1-4 TaxID=2899122 RepID=UPI0021C15010|nr:AAA family ATPase [Photobacterium sp. TY1-4]UXI01511.1 AAA family ATPase [Photobacterium sp. TY1-4]